MTITKTGGMRAEREELLKLGHNPKWVERIDDDRVGRVIREMRRRDREKAKAKAEAGE